MAEQFNFPKSPTVGDQYDPTDGGRRYEWDGDGWADVTSAPTPPPTIPVTTSATAPTSPSNGDKWINSTTGVQYTYITAETAWVDL